MDCSLPGSSIHGIFQARVLEWGAIAFSNIPKFFGSGLAAGIVFYQNLNKLVYLFSENTEVWKDSL